jgi:hypothetical protein
MLEVVLIHASAPVNTLGLVTVAAIISDGLLIVERLASGSLLALFRGIGDSRPI